MHLPKDFQDRKILFLFFEIHEQLRNYFIDKVNNYFIIQLVILILFYLSLVWQLIKFDKNNPQLCLKIFKFNNISGFTLFLTIIFINL